VTLAQAWLAAHGRALREAVTEQRLWLRALETMPSDGTADGRRLAVQRRMASDYHAACLEVLRRFVPCYFYAMAHMPLAPVPRLHSYTHGRAQQ
jgi:hypothetical protein